MDIVEVRVEIMNKAIAKTEYDAVKNLILERIKIPENKDYPGGLWTNEKRIVANCKTGARYTGNQELFKIFCF